MFRVTVSQIVLNQTEIVAAICQRMPASMPEHMRMHGECESSALTRHADQVVDGVSGKLIPALTQKEPRQLRVATLGEVAFERTEFLWQQRLFGREAPFKPCNPNAAMLEVNILPPEITDFR